LINESKNVLLCIVYTPIYRLTEKKKTFPCTKLSIQNGRWENRLCARAPREWNLVGMYS